MGRPRRPQSVKLICGMLGADPDLLRRAIQRLTREFGPVDLHSDLWPFDQTDYYAEQMGPQLRRQFIAFERLVQPDALAGIKHETNALEDAIADDCVALGIPRPVNLDPGYIHPSKLVLASTKDSAHRIAIGAKMYAEITLQYARGAWQPLPWTYPDYRAEHYHAFFDQVRERLLEQWRGEA
jgi:hypothetical protein